MENKFSAGMLVKMSKITDLISKLEGLCNEDIGEGDKDRSSKSETQTLTLVYLSLEFAMFNFLFQGHVCNPFYI